MHSLEQISHEANIKAILGNHLDRLADALGAHLFAPGTLPFEKRYVFVPNEQIQEFLQFHLASQLGIAAGLQFCGIEQGIAELLEALSPEQKKRIPSFLELSLRIEEQLYFCLESSSLRGLASFASLYDYIESGGQELIVKRVLSLSEELARLFIRYSLYGEAFLPDWLREEGWQQWLYKRVFGRDAVSFEAVRDAKVSSQCQVHLFGFSHLPPLYLSFFARRKTVLYLFSPCATYWDDLCSDREKLSIQRSLQNRKASRAVSEEMQGYLQDQHPLLANWGKCGREFLKVLDAYPLEIEEMYEPSEPTLLGSVKNGLLAMEERQGDKSDASIQLHSAPSKLREVEALCDTLLTLLARHASDMRPLQPQDIVVVAPDMGSYAPYVHMVFGNTPYAYQIDGLEQGSTSDFSQGFYHLLSLAEEEFSLSCVVKLFFFAPFRERWGFEPADVSLFSSWLERAQVRTGEPSWEAGIDRLLFGLAASPEYGGDVYPLGCIAQSDVELFNRFLICYQAVKQDVAQMRASKSNTLSEWLIWAQELAVRHFSCDAQKEPLLCNLRLLQRQVAKEKSSAYFSFASLQRILRHFYEKRTGSISAQHLQRIRFCSMHPSAAVPARVVCALGLDEESFPRLEGNSSLCALSKRAKRPYWPLKGDEDRYLFLELLCSAQDYFLLSYVRIHPRDNKPQGPSFLIEELKKAAGPFLEVDHPLFAFDACYFEKDAPVQNLRTADFLLAKCHATPENNPRDFFAASPAPADEEIPFLRLSSLRSLAKNPIKFYFNEVLGIYLKQEERPGEERFCLSSIAKYLLKKECLAAGRKDVIERSDRQGVLPEGLFKAAALTSLSSEVEEQDRAFEQLQIRGEDLFSIEFSPHCQCPLHLENGNRVVPALVLRELPLVGTLSEITPQGYLVHGKKNFESLVSHWPLYLAYLNAHQELPQQILFSQDGVRFELACGDPFALLEEYIGYFLRARRSLSPLMPKWAAALLLKEENAFEKAVETSLRFSGNAYVDPYLEWMQKGQIAIDAHTLYAQWSEDLKHLFRPLILSWKEFDDA